MDTAVSDSIFRMQYESRYSCIRGVPLQKQALTDRVDIVGATGASLKSVFGDVVLDSSGGNCSLHLTGTALQGVAETVTLCGYVRGAAGPTATAAVGRVIPPTGATSSAGDGAGGVACNANGGFLKLTGELATLSGPLGASVDSDHEV